MNEAFFSFDPFDDQHIEGPLFTDETYAEIGNQAEAYLAVSGILREALGTEAREHLAITGSRVAGALARENIREALEVAQAGGIPQAEVSTEGFASFVGAHFGEQHAAHLRYLKSPEA